MRRVIQLIKIETVVEGLSEISKALLHERAVTIYQSRVSAQKAFAATGFQLRSGGRETERERELLALEA